MPYCARLVAANSDPQHRQPTGRRDLDIMGTGDVRDHPLDLQRQLPQHFEIGAIDQDGDVALDACHQFVDPHLDGLAEAELDSGHVLREQLVHFLDQIIAGQSRPPLFLRLEHGPDVGLVHAHHVVGDLGPTGLAVDQPHLGNRLERASRSGWTWAPPLRATAEGMRTASISRSPSLSRGMNSAPMFQAIGTLVITRPAARNTAMNGWRTNRSSTGVYKPLDPADQPELLFLRRGRSRPSEAITGMNESDRTSEPARAKITVRAIGRNSFPSVP